MVLQYSMIIFTYPEAHNFKLF